MFDLNNSDGVNVCEDKCLTGGEKFSHSVTWWAVFVLSVGCFLCAAFGYYMTVFVWLGQSFESLAEWGINPSMVHGGSILLGGFAFWIFYRITSREKRSAKRKLDAIRTGAATDEQIRRWSNGFFRNKDDFFWAKGI